MDVAIASRRPISYSVFSVPRGGLASKLRQACSSFLPTSITTTSSSSSSSLNPLYRARSVHHLCLPSFLLRSSVSGLALPLLDAAQQLQEDELEAFSQSEEVETDYIDDSERAITKSSRPSTAAKFQPLGSKERKQLRAYAHQLGKDLVVQSVGKWGVTSSVIKSFSDALEANELIKVKVLDNCPDELDEILQKLAESTESQIVGKIGRTVLLYRPSLTKLMAEQKKQQRQLKKQRIQSHMSAHRRGIDSRR